MKRLKYKNSCNSSIIIDIFSQISLKKYATNYNEKDPGTPDVPKTKKMTMSKLKEEYELI